MPRKPGGLVRHAVSLVRLPLKRHRQLTWQCPHHPDDLSSHRQPGAVRTLYPNL
jgi:hypothetical protein